MTAVITISEEAVEWIKAKFASMSEQNYSGLKVSVNKKGCAGGEYEFKPVTTDDLSDDLDKIEQDGVTLYYPRTMLLKLFGSELYLFKDQFTERLDFNNPNEVSRCGCGESIQLD